MSHTIYGDRFANFSGCFIWFFQFEDDDKRCHMELNYSFEIKKSRAIN